MTIVQYVEKIFENEKYIKNMRNMIIETTELNFLYGVVDDLSKEIGLDLNVENSKLIETYADEMANKNVTYLILKLISITDEDFAKYDNVEDIEVFLQPKMSNITVDYDNKPAVILYTKYVEAAVLKAIDILKQIP